MSVGSSVIDDLLSWSPVKGVAGDRAVSSVSPGKRRGRPPGGKSLKGSDEPAKRKLELRRLMPTADQCVSAKATRAENKEWALLHAYTPITKIDVSTCPSPMAWIYLISIADDPDAELQKEIAKAGNSRDDLAREQRMMAFSEIRNHLERARSAFVERKRQGQSLN